MAGKLTSMLARFASDIMLSRGGSGYDTCAILTGTEFERGKFESGFKRCRMTKTSVVFYKNEFAMSTTYLNLYMIFGGTNWGGIAHPGACNYWVHRSE